MQDSSVEREKKSEPTPASIWRGVKATLRRLGPAGPLAIVASTLPMVGLATLVLTINVIGPWLRDLETAGVLIYVLGVAVCAGLAIFPTHIQAVLGGWAFGFWLGFPASLAGILGASLIAYVIALRATGNRVISIIEEKPKWRAVYDTLLRGGFWKTLLIVTLVRIPPTSPFAVTNLVMAATRVNPLAYAIGTVVGIAPRTGAAVFLAVGLQEVTSKSEHGRWVWIVGIALTIAIVMVIGQMANKAIARMTATDK